MMMGTVSFQQKKPMQNLGVWGLMGTGVKICRRKYHIWNRQPWFAYLLCHFHGATMMIKGSLLLSAPVVKRFLSEKNQVKSGYGHILMTFG